MIGDGDLGEVVIEGKGRDVALFQASMGRIANLSLRQGGGKGMWLGVDIAQGRLHLEGCDITSQSIASVGIHGAAAIVTATLCAREKYVKRIGAPFTLSLL